MLWHLQKPSLHLLCKARRKSELAGDSHFELQRKDERVQKMQDGQEVALTSVWIHFLQKYDWFDMIKESKKETSTALKGRRRTSACPVFIPFFRAMSVSPLCSLIMSSRRRMLMHWKVSWKQNTRLGDCRECGCRPLFWQCIIVGRNSGGGKWSSWDSTALHYASALGKPVPLITSRLGFLVLTHTWKFISHLSALEVFFLLPIKTKI